MLGLEWTAARVPASVVRLSNGLTIIAHRESKAPVAAVYVAYRAGSRHEPESKAGLAHLCEHLMFTGTRSAPGSYFAPMEQVGAAWMNAYVREDYSAYFETVPVWALDFVLRMEADRMAHLAEALDGAKIDRQREVIRNELRQRESEPFGRATRIVAEMAHPPRHPYAHPPDGILEELDNIAEADVRAWIETRHCAANAAVVIAGDIEPAAAIENARRHFEPLSSVVALAASEREAGPTIDCAPRRVIEERSGQSRLYIVWNSPAFACSADPGFVVACEVLGGGRNSRLWRRVIDADRLAVEVAFQARPRQLGSQVTLSITARPDVPLDALEAAALSEVERLANYGPNPQEVEAARLRIFARLVRGLECVGGPNSKSEILGVASMVGEGPRVHDERVAAIARVEPEAIAAAAGKWLSSSRAVLQMRAAV